MKPFLMLGFALLVVAAIACAGLIITATEELSLVMLVTCPAGFGLLFVQVVLDRLGNKEDDYYSKNVDQ